MKKLELKTMDSITPTKLNYVYVWLCWRLRVLRNDDELVFGMLDHTCPPPIDDRLEVGVILVQPDKLLS